MESRLFINNEFVEAKSGKSFAIVNPYTGSKLADVSEAGPEDIDAAVLAADKAWRPWSEERYAGERAFFLRALADKVRANYSEIEKLESMEMGKPIRQSWFDREVACGCFTYFASLCETLGGETSLNTPGLVSMTIQQPFGVVAGILPWNAPLIMFAFKVGGAVAAGNAILLKPSEKAPLTCLYLAQLANEVGFPPGIINVITGGRETGALLASHMKIRKLSFTGSVRAGRMIQKAAADSNLKTVTLELGGKSPTIIFEDADLNRAAAELARSVGMTSGQVCMASTRCYVSRTVYNEFLSAFKKEFAVFLNGPGDPLNSATTRGPLVDQLQFDTVQKYLELAKEEGEVLFGGVSGDGGKLFMQPAIFGSLSEDSRTMKEESFGPFVNIIAIDTEEEAIAKANDSEMGLYAAVYSQDIDRALRVARRLEAGSVAINANSPTLSADIPYGGWKGSGVGRELGSRALHNWTESKGIFIAVQPRNK